MRRILKGLKGHPDNLSLAAIMALVVMLWAFSTTVPFWVVVVYLTVFGILHLISAWVRGK